MTPDENLRWQLARNRERLTLERRCDPKCDQTRWREMVAELESLLNSVRSCGHMSAPMVDTFGKEQHALRDTLWKVSGPPSTYVQDGIIQ